MHSWGLVWRPRPDAAQVAQAARRTLQAAEGRLRGERARALRQAVHFPELLAQEELLHLGAVDGEVFQLGEQGVLVERELCDYAPPEGSAELLVLACPPRARHKVFRADFGVDEATGRGVPCVLKEYELPGDSELRRLATEVNALRRLKHPHIVNLKEVVTTTTTIVTKSGGGGGGQLRKGVEHIDTI